MTTYGDSLLSRVEKLSPEATTLLLKSIIRAVDMSNKSTRLTLDAIGVGLTATEENFK